MLVWLVKGLAFTGTDVVVGIDVAPPTERKSAAEVAVFPALSNTSTQ